MRTVLFSVCFVACAGLLLALTQPVESSAAPATDVAQPASPAAQPDVTPPQEEAIPQATCFNCNKSSTGACAHQSGYSAGVQCRGSRKSCEAKGCKIGGTGSCSSAANSKKC